jgi:hypothetical protein
MGGNAARVSLARYLLLVAVPKQRQILRNWRDRALIYRKHKINEARNGEGRLLSWIGVSSECQKNARAEQYRKQHHNLDHRTQLPHSQL